MKLIRNAGSKQHVLYIISNMRHAMQSVTMCSFNHASENLYGQVRRDDQRTMPTLDHVNKTIALSIAA